MPSRAMIIVGGGSSSRFGSDKLMAEVEGRPLITHTIDAVSERVDSCVVVCRADTMERVRELRPEVTVVVGGATRTLSEMAGLAALGGQADLIGIHDAARPVVREFVVDRLFTLAARFGGAVPALAPERLVIDRRTHRPVTDLRRVQTPQVFRADDVMTAYVRAAQDEFEAQDTVEVVTRYVETTVVAIQGDPSNIKVTFPDDLGRVAESIRDRSRT